MSIKTPFKLVKLTITAYSNENRSIQSQVCKFEALFNPESYSKKYAIEYGKNIGEINGEKVHYARNKLPSLSFKLILDGTGSQEVRMPTDKIKSVTERIDDLLKTSFNMNGDIHEPNYLKVAWGDLDFPCRLSSLDINYTSFNPDGTPLRAELTIDLLSDEEVKKQMAREDKKSPDITHSLIVKNGDTLPLLSQAIYGSASHYLWVAQQNQLDDFRNLTPGQRLFFPPLVS